CDLLAHLNNPPLGSPELISSQDPGTRKPSSSLTNFEARFQTEPHFEKNSNLQKRKNSTKLAVGKDADDGKAENACSARACSRRFLPHRRRWSHNFALISSEVNEEGKFRKLLAEAFCVPKSRLFLPAVVRPILDSFESSKQVPPPALGDVVAGMTGKKQG
ncbi:fiber protein fb11, partial [Striga asiatica]